MKERRGRTPTLPLRITDIYKEADMANTDSKVYGEAKTYEVTWTLGNTERVQAHYLGYPDGSNSKGGGFGHIRFWLSIDGKSHVAFSAPECLIKSVRLVPDGPEMVTKLTGTGGRLLTFEKRFLDRAKELLKYNNGMWSGCASTLTSEMGLRPHESSLPYDILGIADLELRASGYKYQHNCGNAACCRHSCV